MAAPSARPRPNTPILGTKVDRRDRYTLTLFILAYNLNIECSTQKVGKQQPLTHPLAAFKNSYKSNKTSTNRNLPHPSASSGAILER